MLRLRIRTVNQVLQLLSQLLRIRLRQLLIGKDALHYIVLVFFLNKTAFNSKSFLALIFARIVGHFFHPNPFLPLVQIASHLKISIDWSQFANLLGSYGRLKRLV
mgnify:CR=1 FL=1